MELRDFLDGYREGEMARFHMPGHKGSFPPLRELDFLPYDITEVEGADVLYQSEGIIAALEAHIAEFYGAGCSAISTGGSTLCIQAMLAAAFSPGDTVIAVRNAHIAFINACILLDLRPVWVTPAPIDRAGVSGPASPAQIAAAIEAHPDAKGVYLTSPDYLGLLTDVEAVASLCRAHGLKLLVDNAHGAALKLAEPDLHPITLGADFCCDSAHKTLPVLTGGAFLHCADSAMLPRIKEGMALFGTTSPSYLTMLSIDLCMEYLTGQGTAAYRETAARLREVRQTAARLRVPHIGRSCDPFRLTVHTAALGYSDEEAGEHFRDHMIEPEYVGGGYVVLMAAPFNEEWDWLRLTRALGELAQDRPPLEEPPAAPVLGEAVLTPREAAFAPAETILTAGSAGRIAARAIITCPPGVPVVVPGEKITPQSENILKNSGNFTVKVVK